MSKIDISVARLEERQVALDGIVKEIKDNHLVHISDDVKSLKQQVDKLSMKIAYYTGGFAVLTFIFQFMFYYFIYKK